MLRPSAIDCSIAGTPAAVAGILTIKFGRLTVLHNRRASRIVACVSLASFGETSMDTKPSAPPVRSKTGASTSAAFLMSSIANASKISPADLPSRARRWRSAS